MSQIISARLKEQGKKPHWDSEETIFNYGNAETVTLMDTVGTELHTTQTSAFGVVAEDANTPKNTKVYLPAMWERNTTDWTINGNWMTPCYINHGGRL